MRHAEAGLERSMIDQVAHVCKVNLVYLMFMLTVIFLGVGVLVFDRWRDNWPKPDLVEFVEPLPVVIEQVGDEWTYSYQLSGRLYDGSPGTVSIFIVNLDTGLSTGPVAKQVFEVREAPRDINFQSQPRYFPIIPIDGLYTFQVTYTFEGVPGVWRGYENDSHDDVGVTYITESFRWDRGAPSAP